MNEDINGKKGNMKVEKKNYRKAQLIKVEFLREVT